MTSVVSSDQPMTQNARASNNQELQESWGTIRTLYLRRSNNQRSTVIMRSNEGPYLWICAIHGVILEDFLRVFGFSGAGFASDQRRLILLFCDTKCGRNHNTMHSGYNDYEIDALSTGSFAPPLTRSLTPLTHSLAPHCSLRSRAPLRSFVRSLARSLTHSLRSSWESDFCLWIECVNFIQFQPSAQDQPQTLT